MLSVSRTNTLVLRYPGLPSVVVTANPSNIRHILTNIDFYPKGEWFNSCVRDIFGGDMFVLDGDQWKDRRKATAPLLGSRAFQIFAFDIACQETVTELIPTLERASRADCVLDLQETIKHFMFGIFRKVVFGKDIGDDTHEDVNFVHINLKEACMIAVGRLLSVPPFVWKVSKFLNIGAERRLKRSISAVHRYIEAIVRLRLARPILGKDIISMLIKLGDNTVESLRDDGVGSIIAGMDTVGSALTWFFWVLATNPRVESKILAELDVLRVRRNKTLGQAYTADELLEMHYLHAAITESLRLYPPVPVDIRECLAEEKLPDGKTIVKKGWHVIYSTYAMGRIEKVWGKDCLEMKPERWLSEDGFFRQERGFKFPAFSAGPRVCPGKDVAYVQMKMIIASVIERFAIELKGNGKSCPEKVASLFLMMKDGLLVKVRERSCLVSRD